MRACIYRRFGGPDVLEWVEDWPAPTCGPGQLRARIAAVSVNPKDALLRAGRFRFRFPIDRRRLPRGTPLDGAGTIIAVGSQVQSVAVGDAVFGMTNRFTGGVLATDAVFNADEMARRPAGLGREEAAAPPLAGLTALQALRNICQLQPGQRVLVIGASGGVGHFAVQIAGLLEATVDATASAVHHEWIKSLGAARVFDHHALPVGDMPGTYDAVFDVSGRYGSADLARQLGWRGVFVSTVPSAGRLMAELAARIGVRRSPRLVIVRSNRADLACIGGWAEEGRLKPSIHNVFSAGEIVAAHRQIQTSHTAGKSVIYPCDA